MCIWQQIAAGAINAAASHKQANTDNAISEYKGRVASNNAQVAMWQAEDAKVRGDQAASQSRRQYASLQGTQEASMAARGLDVSYGTPNAILTDTDYFGAYDEGTIRGNSRRDAWAYTVQADNYTNEVKFLHDQRKGNNPWVAGLWGFAKGFAGSGGFSNLGSGGMGSGSPQTAYAGSNDYGGNTLLTSSGSVASRWYG